MDFVASSIPYDEDRLMIELELVQNLSNPIYLTCKYLQNIWFDFRFPLCVYRFDWLIDFFTHTSSSSLFLPSNVSLDPFFHDSHNI